MAVEKPIEALNHLETVVKDAADDSRKVNQMYRNVVKILDNSPFHTTTWSNSSDSHRIRTTSAVEIDDDKFVALADTVQLRARHGHTRYVTIPTLLGLTKEQTVPNQEYPDYSHQLFKLGKELVYFAGGSLELPGLSVVNREIITSTKIVVDKIAKSLAY